MFIVDATVHTGNRFNQMRNEHRVVQYWKRIYTPVYWLSSWNRNSNFQKIRRTK